MSGRKITIGTRGSTLSLAQTKLVADALMRLDSGLQIETKIIVTKGDVNQSPIPLDTIGKSWFTTEIEEGLISGDIDLAIHSLKDLAPETTNSKLTIIPVLMREDPSDVLVSKTGAPFGELRKSAILGTDSTRRAVQLSELRSDLIVKSIRGNVDTRLRKLREEEYDGIVIAAAGLIRLGRKDEITETFDPATFIPAPGQGALAAQVRNGDDALMALLKKLVHEPTRIAVTTERAFSRAVGGGCKLPVGCFARVTGETIELYGMAADDAGAVTRSSLSGKTTDAVQLARTLAQKLGF